jgi:hypothetical protein
VPSGVPGETLQLRGEEEGDGGTAMALRAHPARSPCEGRVVAAKRGWRSRRGLRNRTLRARPVSFQEPTTLRDSA